VGGFSADDVIGMMWHRGERSPIVGSTKFCMMISMTLLMNAMAII
jgi:hypothetical protein